MNFISAFDELNKLYEEATLEKKPNKANGVLSDKDTDEVTSGATQEVDNGEQSKGDGTNKLTEAEEEIPVDEEPVEEVPAEDSPVDDTAEEDEIEDEPKQVICECDKCGALVIVDEADVVVDEESDLVNVEDECKFCEEKAGFKIVGIVAPYNPDEIDMVTEDLADWYRKKFDKPASISAQQSWEDELNGECGEISDKRRKHLERKFAQQRDWEARHPETDPARVDEFFDLTPNISLSLDGGEGNDVDVL